MRIDTSNFNCRAQTGALPTRMKANDGLNTEDFFDAARGVAGISCAIQDRNKSVSRAHCKADPTSLLMRSLLVQKQNSGNSSAA
jgi:hypothetical protein